MAPSAAQFPSSAFYELSLSGAAASKVNFFEGMPISTNTLEISGYYFSGVGGKV